jgi:hypothetical protein
MRWSKFPKGGETSGKSVKEELVERGGTTREASFLCAQGKKIEIGRRAGQLSEADGKQMEAKVLAG